MFILEPLEIIKKVWLGSGPTDPGIFGQAVGGTIFLDLADELNDHAQKLLLKLVELSKTDPKMDIRFISSLGKSEQSKLRLDLYRQLSEIEIYLPPLSERPGDIPTLIGYFLNKYSHQFGFKMEISKEASSLLQAYNYTYNVAELERAIRLAFRRAGQGIIRPEHLPREIREFTAIDPFAIRLNSVRRQLHQYQNNLNILEERRAQYSLDAPVSLLNEIEVQKKEIEKLTTELEQLENRLG
jgi:DNA-binding NtrC family response regulator